MRNKIKYKCHTYASWKPTGIMGYLTVIRLVANGHRI